MSLTIHLSIRLDIFLFFRIHLVNALYQPELVSVIASNGKNIFLELTAKSNLLSELAGLTL